MARKIKGAPVFDMLQLMKIVVNRGGKEDGCEATIAYVHSKSQSMFGSVILAQNSQVQNLSKKSNELVSKLIESLEEDAATLIFNETQTEESKQEGIHVQEPKGIVDAEEEAPQV